MTSTLSSQNFLLIFWLLTSFVVVFIVRDLLYGIFDDLWMTNILVVSSFKAVEFNGAYTTRFLKNFVALIYLLIFVDILKSKCLKKKNPINVEK